MKNYMPLDGLRCSRDSGSAHCDTPKSAVLGRPGGKLKEIKTIVALSVSCWGVKGDKEVKEDKDNSCIVCFLLGKIKEEILS